MRGAPRAPGGTSGCGRRSPAPLRAPAWWSPARPGTSRAQLVDDSIGRTLASASTLEADLRAADGDKSAKARKVGELVGRRAVEPA